MQRIHARDSRARRKLLPFCRGHIRSLVNRRKSEYTRRAYRADVIAFVGFRRLVWLSSASGLGRALMLHRNRCDAYKNGPVRIDAVVSAVRQDSLLGLVDCPLMLDRYSVGERCGLSVPTLGRHVVIQPLEYLLDQRRARCGV